jgi:hypothetical protein
MSPSYVFDHSWQVAAPRAAAHDVLVDLEHYPDWWPQVVAVASLGEDDARVLCRSVLPYTLDLVLHAADRSPDLLEVTVAGDLAGWARFRLSEVGDGTRLDFSQQVSVSGLLGVASYVARPLLRWNHHRMMVGCAEGLAREVRRRRTRCPPDRA